MTRRARITAADPLVSPATVPLAGRSGVVYVNLGSAGRLTLPPGARVCVRSLAVGWLGP